MSEFFADDTIEILLDIREQGMSAFRETRHQLEEIAAASLITAAATERLNSSAHEAARGLDKEADQLAQVKRQAAETSVVMTGFAAANSATAATLAAAWAALTFPTGWAQVVLSVIALLLGPLLVFGSAIITSTAVMAAWIVGAAAMVTLLGGLAIGFAAVGAAVIALGIAGMGGAAGPTDAQLKSGAGSIGGSQQRLFDAQQSLKDLQERVAAQHHPATLSQQQQMEDLTLRIARAQDAHNAAISNYAGLLAASHTPVQRFKAEAEGMLDALEKASVPLARMAINFAAGFLPLIQSQGEQLINWFGARMPGALVAMSGVIKDLTPVFDNFGGFLGAMFDRFSPEFARRFEDSVKVVLPVVQGLINVLASVTEWFFSRLPAFAPIASAVLGFVGGTVENLAKGWGMFADWGAKTFWPLLRDIQTEWNRPGVGSGLMDTLRKDLPQILGNLDTWVKNSPKWIPAITDVAGAIVNLATAFTNAATQFGIWIVDLTAWANNNSFWSDLQSKILGLATWLGQVLSKLGEFGDWLAAHGIDTPPSQQKPQTPNSPRPGQDVLGQGDVPRARTTNTSSKVTHNSIVITGVDANSADHVAAGITRALRSLGEV